MARNVPPRQILRRAELRLRERLAAQLYATPARQATPALATPLPPPLFPPRLEQADSLADGFRLNLPWGGRSFTLPVDWHLPAGEPLEGSWRHRLHYMEFLEGLRTPLLERVVLDWIERNPLRGPRELRFAWHPFATSIRAVVWMQQIALRHRELSPRMLERAAASLAAQLRFVERHHESDLRGNHLIKNIKALLWGGAFFSGAEGERWRRLGRRLLAAELDEQILADGVHYERSPTYHCQVMADLLECHAVLPEGAERAALTRLLPGMGRAAALLTHPDGDIAQFNDSALHNAYASSACLAALARLGEPARPADGSFALPEAGYFIDRRGDDYLIVDCGAVAPPYLIGHGHGDILSFEWSLGGRRIIVDQGTYQNAAGPRRAASRSTLNHNTLSIDGEEQCDFYGAHRCGRRAVPELLEWRPTSAGFVLAGSHDGFAHLPGRPRPWRRFTLSPNRLVVEDRLLGGAGQAASAAYLCHPACRVEVEGARARITCGPVTVDMEAPGPLRLEEAEWYPDLYVALPAKRLRLDLPRPDRGERTVFTRRDR